MINVEMHENPLQKIAAFLDRPLPKLILRGAVITALALAAVGLLAAAAASCPPISSVVVYVTLSIGIRIALMGIAFFALAGFHLAFEDYDKHRHFRRV